MTDAALRGARPLQGIVERDGRQYFDAAALCTKCLAHYMANPSLTEACASVGIENGKSSGLMLAEYFTGFHQQKHRENHP